MTTYENRGKENPLIARLAALCAVVLILTAISLALPTKAELGVYDGLVRLHVLANSDSEIDQSIKMSVRDAILTRLEREMIGANDAAEASAILLSMTDEIAEVASERAKSLGAGYTASVALSHEVYPERSYGSITLPAGGYISLRVMLGEAEGENFWCVLFPPLCLDSARAKEKLAETGFTPGQIRFITESESGRFTFKLRFLEFFAELKASLAQTFRKK